MRTAIRFSTGSWRYKIDARKLFYQVFYRTPRTPIKIDSFATGKGKVEINYRYFYPIPLADTQYTIYIQHTIYLERGQ